MTGYARLIDLLPHVFPAGAQESRVFPVFGPEDGPGDGFFVVRREAGDQDLTLEGRADFQAVELTAYAEQYWQADELLTSALRLRHREGGGDGDVVRVQDLLVGDPGLRTDTYDPDLNLYGVSVYVQVRP